MLTFHKTVATPSSGLLLRSLEKHVTSASTQESKKALFAALQAPLEAQCQIPLTVPP
jgi:hypothetical protein